MFVMFPMYIIHKNQSWQKKKKTQNKAGNTHTSQDSVNYLRFPINTGR